MKKAAGKPAARVSTALAKLLGGVRVSATIRDFNAKDRLDILEVISIPEMISLALRAVIDQMTDSPQFGLG
jgi:hypothetical protein